MPKLVFWHAPSSIEKRFYIHIMTFPKKSIQVRCFLTAFTIAVVLISDQIVKYLVKTNMFLYEKIEVTDWFQICFIENRGMAFGMDFIGTTFLSIFRIAAIIVFAWILVRVVKQRYSLGFIFTLSLIVAGAIGNLIDNCFYGLIFEESTMRCFELDEPAQLVGWGQGYGSFLSGKVVDMFYFPLFTWPDWVPFLGGEIFFNAIFNVADAAISCGAVSLVLFYRHVFSFTLK